LREYLLEEDAKKNIWSHESGGNKKLEKISKDLLNCTSGQILLGWSIQGGWNRRIFNKSSSFFTNCHNAYELKCVNKQMPRLFPLDFPDYLKVFSIPFYCSNLPTYFPELLPTFNIDFEIEYTRRCTRAPDIMKNIKLRKMG